MAKKKPTPKPETVQIVTFSQILIPIVITISVGLGIWAAIDLGGFITFMIELMPWAFGGILTLGMIMPIGIAIFVVAFVVKNADRVLGRKKPRNPK